MSERPEFTSWGRIFAARQSIVAMPDRSAPLPAAVGSLLPFGLGRSYGDSCLNDGQTLIRARDLDRFISFDPENGLLRCEAGVLLDEIIAFALPRGWFLPVTPGSRFVTVGGAIANDVHGKNHHRAGSFGHFVTRFELLRSDVPRTTCSPTEAGPLYRATIGGLGLTGLITWAELRLRRVPGPWMRQRAIRFRSLDEFFALCEPLEREHEYVVAWLDCASRRASDTRGILFAANHDPDPRPGRSRSRIPFPFSPRRSLVNRFTLRCFNELYYRIPRAGLERPAKALWEPFFYPLDRIARWNRLYGASGFFQYQCGVPEDETGRAALRALLDRIAAAAEGSFLAVLKRFGAMPPAGVMSFPRSGYTLALDFPNRGAATRMLLDKLDAVVVSAGGRVYPAKDARMSPEVFRAFYPEWEAFARHVDPRFSSSFWRRVAGGPPAECA